MPRGFTAEGIHALGDVLERHVERGEVPGLVALVARGGEVHVEAIGHKAFGDSEPIGSDAIFRIASITKPIAGVAAMLLIEDGAMALGDPVGRWLPELAEPRVLRTLDSGLDDTVAAERPITVEDVLSFRLGFGSIMTPGDRPVQRAESELGLKTLGPPWPPPDLTPDEWITRLGGLPLLDQPGARWRYNTGATVAGVLIERVAGAPLADVLRERVFGPLGMKDTGFYVPAAKLGRFTTFYAPDTEGGGLHVIDRPEGWYSSPPKLPDASGWLVSTVDDLWAFASMLAADGGNLLSAESVRLMTRDRMTARDRAENRVFVGDHSGWGLMMLVPAGDGSSGVPGGYGWEGGSGTAWRTDAATGLTGILLTQRQVTSPEPTDLVTDFWTAAYAAIDA
ncbi:MAG: beta-lactamase family protein [Streptosporangiaceae bacterium]|nr:beta-lactamase family protein [Streptosporangiaceae bacterium]MBV9857800.1 beta-lactamase family protein [Streptosporangiaceae bacterium]